MNDIIKSLVIDLQYFANVNWYKTAHQYKYVEIMSSERHTKMSFRNRLWISGADGLLNLSVPIERSRNERQLYKDVRIAPGRWAISHFRTITSCYNRSPWFEHYRDELAALFETKHNFLWDWNLACFNWMNSQLPFPKGSEVLINAQLNNSGGAKIDLRDYFKPANKAEWISQPGIKYAQVFEDRVGFIPGLSVLDLLFCEGPASRNWLI